MSLHRTIALTISALFLGDELSPNCLAADPSKFERVVATFQTAWSAAFANTGRNFPMPRMVPFSGSIRTPGCGVVDSGNAYFCPADNAIYYDVNFLGEVRAGVARATGTDGDYAPIAVIAHELGHAVAYHMLPGASLSARLSYRINETGQESLADCLAGAVTRTASMRGLLDNSDFAEGQTAMEQSSTYFLPRDANGKVIVRAGQGHPLSGNRVGKFRAGFEQGAGVCGGLAGPLTLPR